MSGGRTIWWAKDSAWWRRERIVELGEEFGAAGPGVIDWLSCEAKLQNEGGRVKSGRRSVARGSFTDVVTVGHVLSRAVTLGLLDDFKEADGLFVCRISGWRADQDRAQAAYRKARQRDDDREETPIDPGDPSPPEAVTNRDQPGHVTVGHAESHIGEDRTEVTTAPQPPKGGRARDLDRFEAEFAAWATRHFPDAQTNQVQGAVSWMRARDIDLITPEAIHAFVDRNPQFAFPGCEPATEEAAA